MSRVYSVSAPYGNHPYRQLNNLSIGSFFKSVGEGIVNVGKAAVGYCAQNASTCIGTAVKVGTLVASFLDNVDCNGEHKELCRLAMTNPDAQIEVLVPANSVILI